MPNPEHLMCHTGVLHYVTQAATVDDAGDLVTTETDVATKFWLHQTGQSEDTALANTQSTDAELWLPAATTPDGLSALTGLGKRWEFIGPPMEAYNARTGVRSHWQANVRSAQ